MYISLRLQIPEFLIEPGGEVALQRDVSHRLLPLDRDALTERTSVHPVQALAALHREGFLHRLVEVEDLVLRNKKSFCNLPFPCF